MSARTHRRRRFAAGFTLIEVLVSLVILGIGVLGIAKLTLYSVRSNDSAYLRTQATMLAQSGLDYMRSNRLIAITGVYTTALGAGPPAAASCFFPNTCTPTALATYDLNQWKTRLAAALPSGTGAITTAVVGDQVTATITVQWDDAVAQSTINKAAAGVAQPMQIVLETVL